MCEICELNKKLGIPNYLCIERMYKLAKKTKLTKIIDMKPRLESVRLAQIKKEQENLK